MNILMYAHFAGSPEMGMVFGHYYLAREWVRAGHKVTIVCASYVHTRNQNPEVAQRYTQRCLDGIDYVFVKCPRYDSISNVGRALNIITFTLFSWFYRPTSKPDVVISSSHHTLTAFIAKRVAKKWGAKLIFEVRDLWPLGLIEIAGVSPKHPFIRLLQWGEDFSLKYSDRVVSVLPFVDEYFASRGMDRSKFCFIPNGADLSAQAESLPDQHCQRLRKFKEHHQYLMGYVGGINTANDLDLLIKAMPRLVENGIGVILLGAGPRLPYLLDQASILGLPAHLLHLEAVDKLAVSDFLKYIDVAYMGFTNQSMYRFGVSPTKINDYLLAGVPVVFATDASSEIDEAGGLVARCKAGDHNEVAETAIKLCKLSDDELLAGREQARRWLENNRDYRVLAHRFLDGL